MRETRRSPIGIAGGGECCVVRIRLRRGGKKNRPFYRVVVVDSRARRDGRVLENVGYYDPLTVPSTIRLSGDRIQWWVGKGAQMSRPVKALFKRAGALEPPTVSPVGEPAPPPAGPEA